MEDDIDIEEHDVLDNPRIRDIFPDLSKVKTEPIEDDDIADEYDPYLQIKEEIDYTEEQVYDTVCMTEFNNFDNVSEIDAGIHDLDSYHETAATNYEVSDFNNDIDNFSLVNEINAENVLESNGCSKSQMNNNGNMNGGPILQRLLYSNDISETYNSISFKYCSQIVAGGTVDTSNNSQVDSNVLSKRLIENIENKESLPCFVVLKDWGTILKNSLCYCHSCKILFPTENSLDAHKMSAHSFLVAFNKKSIQIESDYSSYYTDSDQGLYIDEDVNNINLKARSSSKYVKKRKLSDEDSIKSAKSFREAAQRIRKAPNIISYFDDKAGTQCYHCNKKFTNHLALIKHLYTVLPDNDNRNDKINKTNQTPVFKCDICKEVFTNETIARFHKSFIHPNRSPIKNGEEISKFKTNVNLNNLKRKLEVVDNNKTDIARTDKIDPSSADQLLIKKQELIYEYQKGHTIPNPPIPKSVFFKCDKCKVHFIMAITAYDHYKSCKTYKTREKCNVCKRQFVKRDLEIHKLQHLVTKSHKAYVIKSNLVRKILCRCPKCGLCFSERLFWAHLHKPCGDKAVPCKKCNLNIDKETYIRTKHKNCSDNIVIDYFDKVVDKGKKVYKLWYCEICDICGRFDTVSHDCPYKLPSKGLCDHCGCYFSWKTLKRHEKLHSENQMNLHNFLFFSLQKKKFVYPPMPFYKLCTLCNVYYLKWNHNCSKNYKVCDICSKRFDENHYDVHKQFHMYNLDSVVREALKSKGYVGIKHPVYKCGHCACIIDSYDNAVRHAQRHITIRSIEKKRCKTCGQQFESASFKGHDHKILTKNKILTFDYNKLLCDTWFDIFEGLDGIERVVVLMDSIFKDTRVLDLKWVQKGDPNMTLYVCSSCNVTVDKSAIENHVSNKMYCWENRDYKCSICNLYFYSPGTMEAHNNLHIKGVKKEDLCIISINNTVDEPMLSSKKAYGTKKKRKVTTLEEVKSADSENNVKTEINNARDYKMNYNCKLEMGNIDSNKTKDVTLYKCLNCMTCIVSSGSISLHICSVGYTKKFCNISNQWFSINNWENHKNIHSGNENLHVIIKYFKPKVHVTNITDELVAKGEVEADDSASETESGEFQAIKDVNTKSTEMTVFQCTNCKKCILIYINIKRHKCDRNFIHCESCKLNYSAKNYSIHKAGCNAKNYNVKVIYFTPRLNRKNAKIDNTKRFIINPKHKQSMKLNTKSNINSKGMRNKKRTEIVANKEPKNVAVINERVTNKKKKPVFNAQKERRAKKSEFYNKMMKLFGSNNKEDSYKEKKNIVEVYKCSNCNTCSFNYKKLKYHVCVPEVYKRFCQICQQSYLLTNYKHGYLHKKYKDVKLTVIRYTPQMIRTCKKIGAIPASEKSNKVKHKHRHIQVNTDSLDVNKRVFYHLYLCRQCDMCFLTRPAYHCHVTRNVHNSRILSKTLCKYCQLMFPSVTLRKHEPECPWKDKRGYIRIIDSNTEVIHKWDDTKSNNDDITSTLEDDSNLDTNNDRDIKVLDINDIDVSENETNTSDIDRNLKNVNYSMNKEPLLKSINTLKTYARKNKSYNHKDDDKRNLNTKISENVLNDNVANSFHVSENSSYRVYVCRRCSMYFVSKYTYQSHISRNIHKSTVLARRPCRYCKLIFPSITLRKHEPECPWNGKKGYIRIIDSKREVIHKWDDTNSNSDDLISILQSDTELDADNDENTNDVDATDIDMSENETSNDSTITKPLSNSTKDFKTSPRNKKTYDRGDGEIQTIDVDENCSSLLYVCRLCDIYFVTKAGYNSHLTKGFHKSTNIALRSCKYCKLRFTVRSLWKHELDCPWNGKRGYIRIIDSETEVIHKWDDTKSKSDDLTIILQSDTELDADNDVDATDIEMSENETNLSHVNRHLKAFDDTIITKPLLNSTKDFETSPRNKKTYDHGDGEIQTIDVDENFSCQLYVCRRCDINFVTKAGYKSHLSRGFHKPTNIALSSCKYCKLKFTMRSLWKHELECPWKGKRGYIRIIDSETEVIHKWDNTELSLNNDLQSIPEDESELAEHKSMYKYKDDDIQHFKSRNSKHLTHEKDTNSLYVKENPSYKLYVCRLCDMYFVCKNAHHTHILRNNHNSVAIIRKHCKYCKLAFRSTSLRMHEPKCPWKGKRGYIRIIDSETEVIHKWDDTKSNSDDLTSILQSDTELDADNDENTNDVDATDMEMSENETLNDSTITKPLSNSMKDFKRSPRNKKTYDRRDGEIQTIDVDENCSSLLYVCRLCDIYFVTKAGYNSHLTKGFHKSTNIALRSCKYCKLRFTVRSLWKHELDCPWNGKRGYIRIIDSGTEVIHKWDNPESNLVVDLPKTPQDEKLDETNKLDAYDENIHFVDITHIDMSLNNSPNARALKTNRKSKVITDMDPLLNSIEDAKTSREKTSKQNLDNMEHISNEVTANSSHINENSSYIIYVCRPCDMYFVYVTAYKNHVSRNIHNSPSLHRRRCTYCKLTFPSVTLKKHEPECPWKDKRGYIKIIDSDTEVIHRWDNTEFNLVNDSTYTSQDESKFDEIIELDTDCEKNIDDLDTNVEDYNNVTNLNALIDTEVNDISNVTYNDKEIDTIAKSTEEFNATYDRNEYRSSTIDLNSIDCDIDSFVKNTIDAESTGIHEIDSKEFISEPNNLINLNQFVNNDIQNIAFQIQIETNKESAIIDDIKEFDADKLELNDVENNFKMSDDTADCVAIEHIDSQIKLFLCSICDVYFLKAECCQAHIKDHVKLDIREYIQCKLCLLQFLIIDLHMHMVSHHGENVIFEDILIEELIPESETRVYKLKDKVQSVIISTTTES